MKPVHPGQLVKNTEQRMFPSNMNQASNPYQNLNPQLQTPSVRPVSRMMSPQPAIDQNILRPGSR